MHELTSDLGLPKHRLLLWEKQNRRKAQVSSSALASGSSSAKGGDEPPAADADGRSNGEFSGGDYYGDDGADGGVTPTTMRAAEIEARLRNRGRFAKSSALPARRGLIDDITKSLRVK